MLARGVGAHGPMGPICPSQVCFIQRDNPIKYGSFMTGPPKLLTFRRPCVLVKVSEMSGFSAKTESKLCIMIFFSLLKATQCLSDTPIIPPLQQSVINCGVINFSFGVFPCATIAK